MTLRAKATEEESAEPRKQNDADVNMHERQREFGTEGGVELPPVPFPSPPGRRGDCA